MNERALGIYLLVALIVFLGVHVVVVTRVARGSSARRALLALVLPPLAPFYAWEAGHSRYAIAWAVALLAYVVGVALA